MPAAPDDVISDLRLAADFAPATSDDWRKAGRWRTERRAVRETGRQDLRRSQDRTRSMPRAKARAPDRQPRSRCALAGDATDRSSRIPPQANAQVLHDLENGATGLTLVFAGRQWRAWIRTCAGRRSGQQNFRWRFFSTQASPHRVADRAAVALRSPLTSPMTSGSKSIDPAACDIRFGLDPLGACAVWGSSPLLWAEIVPGGDRRRQESAALGFQGLFIVARRPGNPRCRRIGGTGTRIRAGIGG